MQFRVSVVTERLFKWMFGWSWAHRVVVQSRETDWDKWKEHDRSHLFDHAIDVEEERKLLHELYCENPPMALRGKKDITVEWAAPVSV